MSSELAGGILTTAPPGKPLSKHLIYVNNLFLPQSWEVGALFIPIYQVRKPMFSEAKRVEGNYKAGRSRSRETTGMVFFFLFFVWEL